MTVFKKNGELTMNAKGHIEKIKAQAEGKKVVRLHPVFWTGSRGHMTLAGTTALYAIRDICREFGLPFTMGNDAPRGGATGEYIEIKVDRRNRFWKMAL